MPGGLTLGISVVPMKLELRPGFVGLHIGQFEISPVCEWWAVFRLRALHRACRDERGRFGSGLHGGAYWRARAQRIPETVNCACTVAQLTSWMS